MAIEGYTDDTAALNNMMYRYPLDFDSSCPMVIFTPFEYGFPGGDSVLASFRKAVDQTVNSVALYMPGNFAEGMQSNWASQDILGGAGGSTMGKLAAEAGNALKAAAGNKISNTAAATGKIPMPTEILVFSGVENVQLQFKFQLIPVTAKENQNCIDIINNFKLACLPAQSSVAKVATLDYPSIWQIDFWPNSSVFGIENDGYYEDMALVNVGVSYNSNSTGMLMYYDNNPVSYELDLQFKCIRKAAMAKD